MELIVHEFRGSNVRRWADGYFNGQDLANAAGKNAKFARDWVQSKAGRAYIETAARNLKVEISTLVRVVHGGANPGVWMHGKIARRFAQDCSPDLAWWVDELVEAKLEDRPVETMEYHLAKYMEHAGLRLDEHQEHLIRHDSELDAVWGVINSKTENKRIPQEAPIRDSWAQKLGGQTEVPTGRNGQKIDIYVEAVWIVEVKNETCWKQVPGQLAEYSAFDTRCRKMAILFTPRDRDPYTEHARREIALTLNNQGIEVHWHDENVNYNKPPTVEQRTLF